MIEPKPGPTFDTALAAPDNAVKKSSPSRASNIDNIHTVNI